MKIKDLVKDIIPQVPSEGECYRCGVEVDYTSDYCFDYGDHIEMCCYNCSRDDDEYDTDHWKY